MQKQHSSIFLAFEGIDGSGKSTQSKRLKERLQKEGYAVELTFEPSTGETGRYIRKILKGEHKVDERTMAGLFVADRLDHILNTDTGMLRQLQEGRIVISDRYYFSSYAYHSCHMNMEWVIQANSMSASILRPDLNVFIDVPPEVSLERISNNRNEKERYETLDNLILVRENYFKAFELLKNKENILVLNGETEVDKLHETIWKKVLPLLKSKD